MRVSKVEIIWYRDKGTKHKPQREIVAIVPEAREKIHNYAVRVMGWQLEENKQRNQVVFTEGGQLVAIAEVTDRDDGEPVLSECQQEVMTLLAEECGETVQRATKMLRFGTVASPWTGLHNCDALASELGDVMAVIELAVKYGLVSREQITAAKKQKIHAWQEEPDRLRRASASGL